MPNSSFLIPIPIPIKDITEPPKKAVGPHHEVIAYFKEAFEKCAGTPWHVSGGKVGAQVASLLKTHPAPKLKELIDRFFSSTDEFILKSGRDFGVFVSQINKLAAIKVKTPATGIWAPYDFTPEK